MFAEGGEQHGHVGGVHLAVALRVAEQPVERGDVVGVEPKAVGVVDMVGEDGQRVIAVCQRAAPPDAGRARSCPSKDADINVVVLVDDRVSEAERIVDHLNAAEGAGLAPVGDDSQHGAAGREPGPGVLPTPPLPTSAG